MMQKAMKWAGIILCATAMAALCAIYNWGAALLTIAALGGYALWCLADFEEELDAAVEETAKAVAEAIQGEDAPDEFDF